MSNRLQTKDTQHVQNLLENLNIEHRITYNDIQALVHDALKRLYEPIFDMEGEVGVQTDFNRFEDTKFSFHVSTGFDTPNIGFIRTSGRFSDPEGAFNMENNEHLVELRALVGEGEAYVAQLHGQRGVFAKEDIAASTWLFLYQGVIFARKFFDEIIITAQAELGRFSFDLNAKAGYASQFVVCAHPKLLKYVGVGEHPSGFINDVHGTSLQPNVEFVQVKLKWRNANSKLKREVDMIAVRAIRDVKQGEQLLGHYGQAYWNQVAPFASFAFLFCFQLVFFLLAFFFNA